MPSLSEIYASTGERVNGARQQMARLGDLARGKIKATLGDFPEGFNAGAVAGMAGWPGDMAYLADTARRALMGERTGPAPQDFVGTTDYIAAKAGHPIPQSLSGQLGSAVGNLLSPSPGDLAKFAPVLSAIPFWHGSPHKYDVVDLSKIGTGEGAQAYGHGYYGAQAEDVGRTYAALGGNGGRITSTGAPPGKMRVYVNDADGAERLVGDFDPLEADAALTRARSEMGNMYRGEYRWPDPAKESATPLTGEDLLQWDRPLSEQPEHVKKGVQETWAQSLENAGKPDEAAKIRAMESLPDWVLERPGERLFSLFGGMDRNGTAEKALAANGIPGIRYLDGMSRADGAGTHNYVMFDDRGIRLLERNGSPISRAALK